MKEDNKTRLFGIFVIIMMVVGASIMYDGKPSENEDWLYKYNYKMHGIR